MLNSENQNIRFQQFMNLKLDERFYCKWYRNVNLMFINVLALFIGTLFASIPIMIYLMLESRSIIQIVCCVLGFMFNFLHSIPMLCKMLIIHNMSILAAELFSQRLNEAASFINKIYDGHHSELNDNNGDGAEMVGTMEMLLKEKLIEIRFYKSLRIINGILNDLNKYNNTMSSIYATNYLINSFSMLFFSFTLMYQQLDQQSQILITLLSPNAFGVFCSFIQLAKVHSGVS